jgi:hypothetical protein
VTFEEACKAIRHAHDALYFLRGLDLRATEAERDRDRWREQFWEISRIIRMPGSPGDDDVPVAIKALVDRADKLDDELEGLKIDLAQTTAARDAALERARVLEGNLSATREEIELFKRHTYSGQVVDALKKERDEARATAASLQGIVDEMAAEKAADAAHKSEAPMTVEGSVEDHARRIRKLELKIFVDRYGEQPDLACLKARVDELEKRLNVCEADDVDVVDQLNEIRTILQTGDKGWPDRIEDRIKALEERPPFVYAPQFPPVWWPGAPQIIPTLGVVPSTSPNTGTPIVNPDIGICETEKKP